MLRNRSWAASKTLGCLAMVAACSSSGGGGGSGGGSGTCASFAGTHVGQLDCSNGESLPMDTTVVQSGCTVTSTGNTSGVSNTWNAKGNTITTQIADPDLSGNCTGTLNGATVNYSCNFNLGGEAVTCSGAVSLTPAGTGGAGGGGGSGGSGGGSCEAEWGSGDAACDECMTSGCCNEMVACLAGTPCAALVECATTNCPAVDQGCLESFCSAELAAGGTALVSLGDCNANTCGGC